MTAGPLAVSAAAVSARSDAWLELGVAGRPPKRWVRVADLVTDPARLQDLQRDAAAFLLAAYGRTDELAAAVMVLERQLNAITLPAAALFRHHRRVPRLEAALVAVPERISRAAPETTRVRLLDDRFWCLPGDPDHGHPDATVVTDEAALAERFRTEVVAHARSFLDAYAPLVRLGPHQLWAAVTDAVEHGFWFTGSADMSAVVADLAGLVLPRVLPPFTARSGFYPVERVGRDPIWTRRRETCCFYYRLTAERTECVTCPRRTAESRAALLRSS